MVKLIRLRDETYNEIKKMGILGDTFDCVVSRLITENKRNIKKNEMKKKDLK